MTKVTYIDDRTFHKRAKAGELDSNETYLLRKQFACQDIKAVENEDRTLDFIISTSSVDRMNDRIMVEGWDLTPFKSNPVVLFGHDGSEPPVAKATQVGVEGGALLARAQFTSKDLYPFGDMIYRMYLEGFMRATSVGFIPKEFEFREEEDESAMLGFDFTRQELLEFSAVPVPANPEALIQARHAGIDTLPLKQWAEKVLDDWDAHKGMTVGRKTVEQLRKKADPRGAVSITVPLTVQDKLLATNLDRIKNLTHTEVQFTDPIETKETVMVDDNAETPEQLENVELEAGAEDVVEKEADDVLLDEGSPGELAEITKLFEDAEEALEEDEMTAVKEYGDLEDILTHMLAMADECFELLEDPEVLVERQKNRVASRIIKATASALLELGGALLGSEEKTAEPPAESDGDPVKQVVDMLSKGAPSDEVSEEAAQEDILDLDPEMLKELLTDILPEVVQTTVDQEIKNIRGTLD
jgi:hypothetical protein